MSNQNLQTLKGFRDFLPEEKAKRNYVTSKIIEIFERYGFVPLETPTLEYASILLGKYGAEADKLVYTFDDQGGRKVGLRYDQSVPTARVLGQYYDELGKGFRRYQVQNVFRADKPQKGRYREFTQCDIDIFGIKSAIADAEILACTYFSFKNVGFPEVNLVINDRKILFSILEKYATQKVTVFSIIQSIDKLDKMDPSQVIDELTKKGLDKEVSSEALEDIMKSTINNSLSEIIDCAVALGIPKKNIIFTPSLARGLDYYTDMIFEVKIPQYTAGSFGGGGRYDKLIQQLGGPDVPAVGIAFGFDRMVDYATELNLFPQNNFGPKVLVTIFSPELVTPALTLSRSLREAGINTETYPDPNAKLDKQLKYADKKGVPFVVIIGPEEEKTNKVIIKDMKNKTQETIARNDLLGYNKLL